jgi:hypothetical protein
MKARMIEKKAEAMRIQKALPPGSCTACNPYVSSIYTNSITHSTWDINAIGRVISSTTMVAMVAIGSGSTKTTPIVIYCTYIPSRGTQN